MNVICVTSAASSRLSPLRRATLNTRRSYRLTTVSHAPASPPRQRCRSSVSDVVASRDAVRGSATVVGRVEGAVSPELTIW